MEINFSIVYLLNDFIRADYKLNTLYETKHMFQTSNSIDVLTHSVQSQEMCSTFRVETEIMCDVVPKGMQLLQNL